MSSVSFCTTVLKWLTTQTRKQRHTLAQGLWLANVNARLRSQYAIARPSVVCLSVTLVRPTQAVQIFGNISTAVGTLTYFENFTEIVPGEPLRRGS